MDVNVILFEAFTALDFIGPVEALQRIPDYGIRYFSMKGGAVSSGTGLSVETEPAGLMSDGILLVPGGWGTRALVSDRKFLDVLRRKAEESAYCLSVCTGSVLLAAAGILDGIAATSNKKAMDWAVATRPSVRWQRSARWTAEGRIYTSSGVSAGMDMALGFISDRFGRHTALKTARDMEYLWNENPAVDPFSLKEEEEA